MTSRASSPGDFVELFGLKFCNLDQEAAAKAVIAAAKKREKGLVVTPNVDHIVAIHRDRLAREAYQNAGWVFADGMPIVWLSQFTKGAGLRGRVTGADLLPRLCELAAQSEVSVYFSGGMPGVAERIITRLSERCPGLSVVGFDSPPLGFERDQEETRRVVSGISAAKPDLLFLGYGTPKQEIWAYQHLASLNVGPILCFGGAFDMAAGLRPRAPVLMQRAGAEWLWRLFLEPRRLGKRYFGRDLEFFGLAARELLKGRLNGGQS